MAKKNFFTMTILLLAMVVNAWANPTFFPEADGWQRVTSITQSDIGDRYFVFVADGQDLMRNRRLLACRNIRENHCSKVRCKW